MPEAAAYLAVPLPSSLTENRPAGAAGRCVDCPVERSCAYSAIRIYERFLGDPVHEAWPLGVLTDDVSADGVRKALEVGPYGVCVYSGRNDVVDHQVVNLEYEGGSTVAFTMTAFTALDFRKTRIFGTYGSIESDGRTLRVHDFLTDTVETIDLDPDGDASAADGHGGGRRGTHRGVHRGGHHRRPFPGHLRTRGEHLLTPGRLGGRAVPRQRQRRRAHSRNPGLGVRHKPSNDTPGRSARGRPGICGPLSTGGTVDQLPQDVGVTGMPEPHRTPSRSSG